MGTLASALFADLLPLGLLALLLIVGLRTRLHASWRSAQADAAPIDGPKHSVEWLPGVVLGVALLFAVAASVLTGRGAAATWPRAGLWALVGVVWIVRGLMGKAWSAATVTLAGLTVLLGAAVLVGWL